MTEQTVPDAVSVPSPATTSPAEVDLLGVDRHGTADMPAGRWDSVDALIANALTALDEFERFGQQQVDHIVAKASLAALHRHTELATLAVAETGRGVVEDKAVKNIFSCEHVTHAMAGLKTVGVVRRDELDGIVEIASPVGVVCAITPVTNPTSTVIFKALLALKTRNPLVFSFHHNAHECSREAARTVRDAAVAAGAPPHCIQWLDMPSRQATAHLMHHDDVAVILATGGNNLVRAAYSCGKPALGVGPGNVPAYLDHTADLRRAVYDIVLSKSFDNGMVCSSEQSVIIDHAVAPQVLAEFSRLRAYRVSVREKELLQRYLFGANGGGSSCAAATFNAEAVGRSAAWIAERAGFQVPAGTTVILADVPELGPVEPLAREKLCPVLAVTHAHSREHGLSQAEHAVALGGLGHTAVIHTHDERLAEEFGLRMKVARIVWNAPAAHGGIGDIYNAFLPSLSLGCGSYGRNSVSGNIQAAHLINIKRLGRRNNNMQWFKVPPKIYFEPHCLRYLADMHGLHRVTIITGPRARSRGHLQRVHDVLARRSTPVELDIIDDVEADPSIETVTRGAARIRAFQADTLIALGGGSPMDAAKVMWLLYEHPDIDFADMREKFFDIRKRAFTFPETGARAKLVCIPTTAGTGAEVTPFAVITDPATGLKYPLADYTLTPSVAICDPTLTTDLPPEVTADVGFDALTHAIEAYVSVYANDFTDGLCLKAIHLIFDNLERAVHHGSTDTRARERMHNAGTIAGMAFGNAFLGVVHAMAHTLGATYHIPHGRTNAILLPHAIRYNGTTPTKLTAWPKYGDYQAPERLRHIARSLELPATTSDEGVHELAHAIERLRDRVNIPSSFRDAGVDEHTYVTALPQQAINAYNDQCAPANPRMPMLVELEHMMRNAYYGTPE